MVLPNLDGQSNHNRLLLVEEGLFATNPPAVGAMDDISAKLKTMKN